MERKPFDRKEFAEQSNTLTRDVKASAADRITLEIGDSRSAEFIPQAKISRWDETSFSIRRDNGARSFVERDGTIVCPGAKEDVVFYELNGFEDGGLEVELHLKEKPATNVLDFTLQTKELNFFYQPELTPDEIAEGASRPENVVGSYAVYHKTGRNNRVGGKEYKTGKAFHIYRPHATDADGKETWCDLNIENDVLTVTIPQKFLDTAVYPVIVDPTFGYTSVGATGVANTSDTMRRSRATASESGTVTSMSVYAKKDSTDFSSQAGLYIASSDALVSPQSDTTVIDSATEQWWTYNFSGGGPEISAQDYMLTWFNDGQGSSNQVIYRDSTGSDDSDWKFSMSFPTWIDPFTADSSNSNVFSIYATYTVAGNDPLVANQGSYTLTGQSVGLTVNRKITAAQGSYALTGQSVDFTYTPASSGSLFKLTVNAAKVSGSHSDYPAYVDLSEMPAAFWSTVTNGGGDIRTYADEAKTTELAREVVSCDTATDTGELHVKIPSLTTSTVIYIDVDGARSEPAAGSTFGSQAVWSDYELVLHDGAGTDSTGSHSPTDTVSAGDTTGQLGSSTDYDSATPDYTDLGNTFSTFLSNDLTISVWFEKDTNIDAKIIFGNFDGTGANGILNLEENSLGEIRLCYGSTATCTSDNDIDSIGAGYQNYTLTRSVSGTSVKLYHNGSSVYTGALGQEGDNWSTTANLFLGRDGRAASTRPYDGRIDEFRMRTDEVSQDWLTTEYNNQSDAATFWSIEAVSAGNDPLVAEQGSYTLSGQTVGLTVNRKITANQGSYTLTGQATGVTANRLLEAAQGSYALSGQSVDIKASRSLTADNGSYSLTGQDTALTANRTLTAQQGIYSFAGQPVTLTAARTLSIAQGSYTLTGQAVILSTDITLTADQGSYAVSGQAVQLTVNRVISANQGSYAVTGFQVAITESEVLLISQGSYALTGQAVGFTVNRALSLAQGSYTLTGQTTQFARTRHLTASHGTYTITGQATSLVFARLLVVTTGEYTVNGQDVSIIVPGWTTIPKTRPHSWSAPSSAHTPTGTTWTTTSKTR